MWKGRYPILVMVLMLAWHATARAQTLSPYSDFQAMSLSQLNTLQAKLTYVGELGQTPGSVLFGVSAGSLDPSLFVPYRRSQFDYSGDNNAQTFTTTTLLLKAMIDSVATLADVTDGDVDTGGDLSFSLLNTAGGTKVFEAVISSANAQALFGKLLDVFKSNNSGLVRLRRLGCGLGDLPSTAPGDMTSSTSVASSGLRFDRPSAQYVGKVKITNTSGAAIGAPILLTMKSGAEMRVAESEGETCNIGGPGSVYLTLLGSGSLAPGANIEKTLHITNPGRMKLNVSFKVYAGAGTP